MNLVNEQQKSDPLAVFIDSQIARRSGHPVPLVSTDFEISIEAGLALVTTKRVFRNVEPESIEATLTFPVPVHATLFDLRAKIGERNLVAKASRNDAARATYEEAIERGKSAVLHEEVLRGVHMLSVAHIPPGATIEISTTWVTTLTMIKDEGHLRIPLTVGDIYGRSPISDSDDLATGGDAVVGLLSVRSPDSAIRLVGGVLEKGQARIQLNRPIDLVVSRWRLRELKGIAADGQSISLLLEPAPTTDGVLSVAVLVDHSGSMNEAVSAGPHAMSKHALIVAALRALSESIGESDIIDLWEFDNSARRIGSTADGRGVENVRAGSAGRRFLSFVDRLAGPVGGTEIGSAIAATIEQSSARDLILITDGKSHALDVQTLAREGRRISVLLVGEDSLEANIGHLAALTGGEIFVSGGADVGDLFQSAIDASRASERYVTPNEDQSSGAMNFRRAGLTVGLRFGPKGGAFENATLAHAVAVTAASFRLPNLSADGAAELAEKEGIVSHLTSLVLVDEASASQPRLPAQRKVLLPEPASARVSRKVLRPESHEFLRPEKREFWRVMPAVESSGPPRLHELMKMLARIDWGSQPSRLAAGDVSQLTPDLQEILRLMATDREILIAARKLGIAPLILVVGLVASIAGLNRDRSAERIAKSILNKVSAKQRGHLLSRLLSENLNARKGR